MPEYPDIVVYIERLSALIQGQQLIKIRIVNPFFVRTFEPSIGSLSGRKVLNIERMGKRIVFEFDDAHFAVLHLMISGRLQWREINCKISRKTDLAVFDFSNGSLVVTEVASKKRASLHIINRHEQLDELNPGGLEIFDASLSEFRNALIAENHTLKRTLTDPRIFSGIGNAYSDEILHHAKLSPIRLTQKMNEQEIETLYNSVRFVLTDWAERLRKEAGDHLPKKVTAFREDMAVHGRFGLPCPVCGRTVQRIRYAENETNYCPKCQTGGRLLADRSLSRLLKSDWPLTPEELEEKYKPNPGKK
jgi:formamidopyrimidine-DNA glycosylase